MSSELPWLKPGQPFPNPKTAWADSSPAPGLLAAGGALDVATLQAAYGDGIFPWYSQGQPILWWSTDPRMVLQVGQFQLHRSLRKRIASLLQSGRLELRFDSAFARVIAHCAHAPRKGHAPGEGSGWILPEMQQAYCALHAAGDAHSVETWIDGELVAGLYCVALGRAVFGESMFTTVPDGSKIALAGLVAFCRAQQLPRIDCQQVTSHLASLGAQPVARVEFLRTMQAARGQSPPLWRFDPLYWGEVLPSRAE